MRRWTLFVLGVLVSLALTIAMWALGIWGFAFFLFLPFLFWPRKQLAHDIDAAGYQSTTVARCSQCGRVAMPEDRFCPRDGTPL